MTPESVMSLANEAVKLSLLISAPLLGIGLIVGLAIAILQATTQVQEMTLTFVPKIIAVLLTLIAVAPWMLHKMSFFTCRIIESIPQFIR